jgi:hypothetical protein
MRTVRDVSRPASQMPDTYDMALGSLDGLPDVVHTKASTVRTKSPLVGNSETYILQTYRHKEQGDTSFIECIHKDGSFRIVLPPKVTETLARQRDALTDKNRSKAAKTTAAERKRLGIQPGFMKKAK